MLRQESWMDVKALKAQGFSQRAVSRMLGLHRDTVRRVWAEEVPQPYRRAPRPTKVDPHKEHLQARLAGTPGLCATRLFRELRERGYGGAYEAIKVFCRGWKRDYRARQATVRFETGPGVQGQADWGETRQLRFASGEVLTRYFFTMVLSFSRLRFVVYLPEVTQSWLLWAHTRAFDYFGGVPRTILYDNPKQIVRRPRPEMIWQPRLLAFASHYGYVPRACWPARPQTKGKVENAVGFHERDFLLGLEPLPKGDAELNARALVWCDEVALRVSSAIGQPPRERWTEEKPYLLPLPASHFDCRTVETRRVLREAMVSYRANRYSAPARLVGRQLTVKEDFDRTIHFYDDADEVAVHPMVTGRGQRVIVPEHHAPLWQALEKLGRRASRRAQQAPTLPADVSLWRSQAVNVERRPLAAYAALEGRC
jgi:transposase